MRKAILSMTAAAVLAAPVATVHAQQARAQEASWIHVRVDETDGARVRVNLPISLVEVALDAAGKEALKGEDFDWDSESDVSLDDIRRMWRELREAGDAEYVDARDGDEHVRVYRDGDRVHVRVDEDDREKVRMDMPFAIVETLLGTEGDELNVSAAMKELARTGNQELIRIQDDDATVRVWIDDSNAQKG